MVTGIDERQPLLQDREQGDQECTLVEFSKDDHENPRAWGKWRKLRNIAIISLMAVLSPLASSLFAPGIKQIAKSLQTSESAVIGVQTGFVVMLGIGPLILAPLSETFGRKIPTALSPNIATLITLRSITGFFGSVGLANGGGTISDMYEPSERAGIFGWYLLGPLLGPTIGPLLGGMIMQHLNWRWIFWILTIICTINVSMGFIFLEETYKPVLLARRKIELEKLKGGTYYFEGEDDRPLNTKLYFSIQRPVRILFTQPIVFTMATYQALCFAITYSLYTQMEKIYGDGYGFDTLQVGMTYLGPGFGFLVAVLFLVPRIDTVFNTLTRRHNGMEKPEYRLPLANVGSVLIPISLFWFAWTVEIHAHWFVTILSTFFYGLGQIAIFNCTQNYYIDAFENYAASAIAAGALFRSVVGGIVPLFTTSLFEKMGVGWGMSIFGFLSVALAPSPLFFYHYGERLRERFAIQL